MIFHIFNLSVIQLFIRNFIDILSDLFLGHILNIQKKVYA